MRDTEMIFLGAMNLLMVIRYSICLTPSTAVRTMAWFIFGWMLEVVVSAKRFTFDVFLSTITCELF